MNGVANQLCLGTNGNDIITGTAAANVIVGGSGNDIVNGSENSGRAHDRKRFASELALLPPRTIPLPPIRASMTICVSLAIHSCSQRIAGD